MRSNTTARTARRRTFRVAAAVLTAAAALTLTACNGDEKSAGQAGTAPAGSSSSSGSSGGAQGSDAKGKGGSEAGGGQDATDGAAKGGGKSKFCRTSDLVMEAVDSSPDQKVGEVTVQMTNKGAKTCSATGFAGVDLKDID
ncbi:DUF4232 domain-containing protein, partial [Streptomyces sp. NPDC000941]